jgi:hypothetical protein
METFIGIGYAIKIETIIKLLAKVIEKNTLGIQRKNRYF